MDAIKTLQIRGAFVIQQDIEPAYNEPHDYQDDSFWFLQNKMPSWFEIPEWWEEMLSRRSI